MTGLVNPKENVGNESVFVLHDFGHGMDFASTVVAVFFFSNNQLFGRGLKLPNRGTFERKKVPQATVGGMLIRPPYSLPAFHHSHE